MRSIILIGILGVMLGAVSQAEAGQLRHKYFGVLVNYFAPDEARLADDEGVGINVLFGRELNPHLYFEGQAFSNVFETGVNGGADLYQHGVGLDLMATLLRRGSFTPFIIGGVGYVYDDVVPNRLDSGNFYANAGLGVLSRELGSSGMRVRLDARAAYDDFEGGVTDVRLGVGLEIPLSPTELVVREVPVPVAASEAAPAQGYPPRPIPGGVDSDGDGVLDNFDQCPNTLPGTRVNRSGCVVEPQVVGVLSSVHFEWNKSRLLPDARTILEHAALAFVGQPSLRVEIVGHADSTGNPAINDQISQARAEAVRQFLLQRGIPAERMQVQGLGDSQPVSSNSTDMGRWENRRVEFRLERKMPGAMGKQ